MLSKNIPLNVFMIHYETILNVFITHKTSIENDSPSRVKSFTGEDSQQAANMFLVKGQNLIFVISLFMEEFFKRQFLGFLMSNS